MSSLPNKSAPSSSSANKVSEISAAFETQFMRFKYGIGIEISFLEADLLIEQEKCHKFETENQKWKDEKETMAKLIESVLKENEQLKTKLAECQERSVQLESENENLKTEKIAFNKRLTLFLNEMVVSDDIDSDKTTENVPETQMQVNKKRSNDTSLADEENSIRKHQKTTDDSLVVPFDLPNEVTNSQSLTKYPVVRLQSILNPSPTQSICKIKEFSRRNIKKVMDFDNLTPETKKAYQQERARKERTKQYARRQQKHTTYGSLPGKSTTLDELVLDFDLNTDAELLSVDRRLSIKLKPHQCDGVKFMWNACFESIDTLQHSQGGGCILSHCMGLGKTLQVIALVHTLLTHSASTKVNKVLVICPVNVILNWVEEFQIWLKDCGNPLNIYEFSACNARERNKRMKAWQANGGVFIIGYQLFQMYYATETEIFHQAFINPGPDLVVCDEGHLLKNPTSKLSVALNKVHTLRRIILTGSPLQNNLKEYFTMIEFVKPRLLGTEKEFNNRFARPIVNGQFIDSTEEDITLMKCRAYILHKLLEGCVQRRDYSVLAEFLPPKKEYVLFIRLTKVQIDLYKFFISICDKESPVVHLPNLKRVFNHPNALADFARRRKTVQQLNTGRVNSENIDSSLSDSESDKNIDEWWKPMFDCSDELEVSGKMLVLFSILRECDEHGEKLLVFSGCLSTLNVIEHFLTLRKSKTIWMHNRDYLRMDGSDTLDKRKRDVQLFNDETNKRARLFLISTKAGCLGVNLTAANRVVIFDASWNPSDDIQSIFRSYRIGQTKECYVYRFVALGTMEEKVYDRQVSKLSMAKRVVDEQQIGRYYKETDLQQLYGVDDLDQQTVEHAASSATADTLLNGLLKTHRDVIFKHHDHDSLLVDLKDETLTDEEIGDVWEEFEGSEFEDSEE